MKIMKTIGMVLLAIFGIFWLALSSIDKIMAIYANSYYLDRIGALKPRTKNISNVVSIQNEPKMRIGF